MMRSLDASRWQRFWRVEAPDGAADSLHRGKIAVVFAPIGAVFAEWVGAELRPGAT